MFLFFIYILFQTFVKFGHISFWNFLLLFLWDRVSVTVFPWLAWNLICRPSRPLTERSTHLCLPSPGITGMHHHTLQFITFFSLVHNNLLFIIHCPIFLSLSLPYFFFLPQFYLYFYFILLAYTKFKMLSFYFSFYSCISLIVTMNIFHYWKILFHFNFF